LKIISLSKFIGSRFLLMTWIEKVASNKRVRKNMKITTYNSQFIK
jgi:hypothetical protein